MSTKRTTAKEQTKANSYTLKESKSIPNTPFQAHKYNDFWIVTCGQYRHSSNFESYEQASEYVNTQDWTLLAIAMQAIVDATINMKENAKIK